MTREEIKAYTLEQVEWGNSRPGELTGYNCLKCLNRGYINVLIEAPWGCSCAVQECGCMKIRNSLLRIERSGLKECVDKMTFETFKTTQPWHSELLEIARKYSNVLPLRWLLLSGQSGIGKTHLCTAIVGKLLKAGREVIYMPYREVVPELKHTILDESYYKKMQLYKTCEYLYIDDLFKGLRKDKESADVSIMFEILDYRARNRLATIISTELGISQLLDIDEALGGRINQMCGDWKIEVKKDPKKNYRTTDVI
jgi:DNA replication protein DnaC